MTGESPTAVHSVFEMGGDDRRWCAKISEGLGLQGRAPVEQAAVVLVARRAVLFATPDCGEELSDLIAGSPSNAFVLLIGYEPSDPPVSERDLQELAVRVADGRPAMGVRITFIEDADDSLTEAGLILKAQRPASIAAPQPPGPYRRKTSGV
jgi:hypothetical protein